MLRGSGKTLGKSAFEPTLLGQRESMAMKLIRDAADRLKKLAIRLGELADAAQGQPAPKLIPIPVPAKPQGKARNLR
jgi:hypothetical protein